MRKLPFKFGKFNRRVTINRYNRGRLVSSKVRYFKGGSK